MRLAPVKVVGVLVAMNLSNKSRLVFHWILTIPLCAFLNVRPLWASSESSLPPRWDVLLNHLIRKDPASFESMRLGQFLQHAETQAALTQTQSYARRLEDLSPKAAVNQLSPQETYEVLAILNSFGGGVISLDSRFWQRPYAPHKGLSPIASLSQEARRNLDVWASNHSLKRSVNLSKELAGLLNQPPISDSTATEQSPPNVEWSSLQDRKRYLIWLQERISKDFGISFTSNEAWYQVPAPLLIIYGGQQLLQQYGGSIEACVSHLLEPPQGGWRSELFAKHSAQYWNQAAHQEKLANVLKTELSKRGQELSSWKAPDWEMAGQFLLGLRNPRSDLALLSSSVSALTFWFTLFSESKRPLLDDLSAVWFQHLHSIDPSDEEGQFLDSAARYSASKFFRDMGEFSRSLPRNIEAYFGRQRLSRQDLSATFKEMQALSTEPRRKATDERHVQSASSPILDHEISINHVPYRFILTAEKQGYIMGRHFEGNPRPGVARTSLFNLTGQIDPKSVIAQVASSSELKRQIQSMQHTSLGSRISGRDFKFRASTSSLGLRDQLAGQEDIEILLTVHDDTRVISLNSMYPTSADQAAHVSSSDCVRILGKFRDPFHSE